MVEIYKDIAYIPPPLLNQIVNNENKNDSVKWANNNQVCKRGILNSSSFVGVFLMIRKIDICDIPLRNQFVSYDNNPSRYAK